MSIGRRVVLVGAALWLSILACSRADVPPPGTNNPVESTEIPQEGSSPTLPLPSSTVPEPLPATTTPTPSKPDPVVSPTFPPTATTVSEATVETLLYEAQSGDTRRALAVRFGVVPDDITSPELLPEEEALIDVGQLLIIPKRILETGPIEKLLPDSEIVFSPHATDFDVLAFVAGYEGYLTRYREIVGPQWRSGAEVVEIVARNESVNPRILLAILEYEAGWLTNPKAPSGDDFKFPLKEKDPRIPGLYRQLSWVASELGNGYYGWRAGTLTSLEFTDGQTSRLDPSLNAGTVAVHYFFSLHRDSQDWQASIAPSGFLSIYSTMFGDPWVYEYPLFEAGLTQPDLILPFLPGQIWAFTGGPHGAWERESAWAALDFAPASSEPGCFKSDKWLVAAAPGSVVRVDEGTVVLDLDGDGREQSGWALLYLHVAQEGRIALGSLVEKGDRIGFPSCEGGFTTGTHVHIARKYNGEWILADGPIPFNLSGWEAHAGGKPYQGVLTKDGIEVLACPCATQETLIVR